MATKLNINSKLFFIYLPDYYRYTKDFDNSNYKLVRDIIKDLDIDLTLYKLKIPLRIGFKFLEISSLSTP